MCNATYHYTFAKKAIHDAQHGLPKPKEKQKYAIDTHVNIFCLETRLKRVSFACETLRVNASERVPSETNEAFRRDFFRNAFECVRSLTCVQTRFLTKTRPR